MLPTEHRLSCREYAACKEGLEQYCEGPTGSLATYNGPMSPDGSGENICGGYSTRIVADKDFVLRIPANLDLGAVPPLLCVGITTYSPLRHWKVSAGQNVAVVGMGGLGHMAVKLATGHNSCRTLLLLTHTQKPKRATLPPPRAFSTR